MTKRSVALCACVLGMGLARGAPLAGQSIFNSAGLGLPVEALDGRARGLGNFGIGLEGPAILTSDPAAAAFVLLPTGIIAAQPSWVDLSETGLGDHNYFQGTRFPLLALAYPAFSGTFTVHAASAFDQDFSAERATTVVIDGVVLPATDSFIQDGSITSLTAGYARLLDENTAVGVNVGRYSGSLTRALARDFGDPAGAGTVEPYRSTGSWQYSGVSLTGGASTEVFGSVRLAASATWSTDLKADAGEATEGGDRSFSVPLQLRFGVSSVLSDGLTVSASAVRADWTVAEDQVGADTRVRTVHGVGAGIELSQARLLGREAPLRLGFRRTGLPFAVGGGDGTEQVFAGGLALVLNQSNGIVLATTDLGVERGWRTGGIVREDFWRATLSVRLSSF